jgi:protein SCO1/2
MRRFNSIYLAVVLLLIASVAGWYLWKLGDQRTAQLVPAETSATVSEPGGPFQLVDQNNNARSDANFRGKYMLIYFGYTYCPDVCPTTLAIMTAALKKMGQTGSSIVPIFVTIDPARDTPDVMKSYLAAFDPRFIGLTGTQEQITAAAKAYRIFYQKIPLEGGDGYTMNHSSIIYLMGPDGRYKTHFTDQDTPENMASALEKQIRG